MYNISMQIKIILVLFFIIIFIFYNYLYIFYGNNINVINNKYKYNINENLFQVALNSHDFVLNAHYGILTQKIPEISDKHPKLSVVIPVFNSDNFIHRVILSIQNQNFIDFEIIIINDYSVDNSYKIIKKISEQDKRIKIINNTRNMGQFYCRCIGTLISKGKYIFPIDSDDMFLIDDLLYVVYKELQTNKPDILLFRGISTLNIESFFKYQNISLFRKYINNNIIITQPIISKNAYKKCSIQATSIKSELYKKIINIYCKIYLYNKITYCEDCITLYIIYLNAKTCERFLKIGYLNIYRASSNSHSDNIINKMKGEIYYYGIFFKHSNIFILHKILAIKGLNNLMKGKHFKELFKDNKMKLYLKKLFNNIIQDKTISYSNKTFIKNIFTKK